VIERLVPSAVATADIRGGELGTKLFPAEAEAIRRVVDKRRREFVTGRACARLALGKLGVAPVALPQGQRGEPLWPPGVVGSITHCADYRACAVAIASSVALIGIDAEEDAPLPRGVLRKVGFGPELELVRRPAAVAVDRLLFSAKESVYKAWYPLTRRRLGFADVSVEFDMEERTLTAHVAARSPPLVNGEPLDRFTGRWHAHDGVLCTVIAMLGH
jgi:4'-phosphopantetheinyl transferase EntD